MKGAAGVTRKSTLISVGIAMSLAVLVAGLALAAQDRYAVKVPGGLSFSEFKGYETWQLISISHNGTKLAAILGNPAMIQALKAGIPDNGKPFPYGARMAKIHWTPTSKTAYPGPPLVAGTLHDVDFMVKDGKRFADSGGWGYAVFEFDDATDTFRPGNTSDTPPQGNDAKCGLACHTIVKNRDYVFTEFPKR
jgi:hypothetical protein